MRKILYFVFSKLRNKMLLATGAILVAGVASVVWISTTLSVRDSTQTAYAAAAELSKSLVNHFEQDLSQSLSRAKMMALVSKSDDELSVFVASDGNIKGVSIYDSKDSTSPYRSGSVKELNIRVPLAEKMKNFYFFNENKNLPGTQFLSTQINSQNFYQVYMPLVVQDSKIQKVLAVSLDPATLNKAFSPAGVFEKMLVTDQGEVLIKSASAGKSALGSLSELDEEFRKRTWSTPDSLTNSQIRWRSPQSGENFLGHFYKSSISGLGVAVLSPESLIYETVFAVARRSTFLGLAILSLALAFGVMFSDSIVNPILKLVEATREMASGNFSFRLEPESQDEVAKLTRSFNEMAEGLSERERIKEIFGKFHSKAVFQKLLKEDRIRLGGERLPVTVFFSDIRSFTSKSENMTPEKVVEMLNEYMSEMVSVIEKYGGVVDKYVGDAIMAIWGMPEPSPKMDAENALKACLEMRVALKELNARRVARGEPEIKIGMGLNSGEVVAGNIGSPSRMEYTVIGDTVNTASRMESLTKEHQTDLLISESTYRLIENKEEFDFSAPITTQAKGKAESLQVFECNGKARATLLKAA